MIHLSLSLYIYIYNEHQGCFKVVESDHVDFCGSWMFAYVGLRGVVCRPSFVCLPCVEAPKTT